MTLRACEIKSAQHWNWRLLNELGNLIADHEVRLDASTWEWRGFVNLAAFLRQAPEHTREQESRLLEQIGDFLGEKVLGKVARALAAAAPVVVRLQADKGDAEEELRRGIFYRPLEIARYGGKPLVLQGISFVVDIGPAPSSKRRPGSPLRVLAVFSLPQGASPLNLRRERFLVRQRLQALVEEGYALELKVLQFGATRGVLVEILKDEEGWDVIHFSGHGLAAHLALENEDGSVDRIPGSKFAELLEPTRHRL